MSRASNIPRRAMQRRNIPRIKPPAEGSSTSTQGTHGVVHFPQRMADTTLNMDQNAASDDSDESDIEYKDDTQAPSSQIAQSVRKRPKKRRRITRESDGSHADEALGSGEDTDCSSVWDQDSGYASPEEDPNEVAQFYDGLINQYEGEGPTMANHDENTRKMTRSEEERWNKFCKAIRRDPLEALEACKASIFKAYLHWRVKNSRIKKESSIMTYWNILSMTYAVKTSRWMDGGVLFDIGHWIHAKLTPEFGLDRSKKEKSGLFVEDLDLILHNHYIFDDSIYAHERLRVQLALILIIAGATATRPDALIGKVLYEHVEFQLFPPGPGEKRSRLGLLVDLINIKKVAGSSKIIKFGFHEEDTLLHDPVLHMLALAFADGAFINEFSDPRQIYDLEVPANADRLRIPWKPEWKSRPIFRDVEGSNVSLSKALRYGKARVQLINLGKALGYAKRLEFYDIRRGTGRKLNEALSLEERNQAMGHRLGDSSTYVRYYMTDMVGADTQAIVFGSDPQTDFKKLMSRLVRHGNAPKELTEEQKREIYNDPQLTKFRQIRSEELAKFRSQGYLSYAAAKKAGVGKRYEKYRKRVDNLRKTLESRRLESAIAEFHENIHGEEIAQQLKGIKPSKDILAPTTITYELKERAEVAHLLSEAATIINLEEIWELRMKLVSAIARLCKRRESPRRPRASPKSARRTSRDLKPYVSQKQRDPFLSCLEVGNPLPPVPDTQKNPNSGDLRYCPFCKWQDKEVGEEQRNREWRLNSLVRHVRSQHLQRIEMPFNCPYDGCDAIIGTDEHFASHAARGHGDHYPPSIISR